MSDTRQTHDGAHPNARLGAAPPSTPLPAARAGSQSDAASDLRHQSAAGVLASVIAGEQGLREVLHLVAQLAVTTVDGVDEASVTVYREGTGRTAHTAGFAGPNAAALDERQYQSGIGPCLQAARTGQRVLVPSTRAGEAGDFEDFAYHARRAGITSATCLPLGIPGRVVGALNTLTHAQAQAQAPSGELTDQLDGQPGPGPLQGAALAAAEAFAAAAAVVVASAANVAAATEAAQNMQAAMEYRAVIEQAKGVLIARHGFDAEEAFRELRRLSQRDNVKLRQVATDVVAAAVNGGQGRAASDGPHA